MKANTQEQQINQTSTMDKFNTTGKKWHHQGSKQLWRRLVLVMVAILLAGGALVYAFAASLRGLLVVNMSTAARQSDKPTSVPVLTVSVEPAKVRPIHQEIKITGSIWAWDPLAISAEVGGLKIESVLVEEGNTVKTGQTLATLNSSVLKAELTREQAQYALSTAALAKAVQPNRKEDINALRALEAQTRANVAQQKAVLIQAQANVVNARNNESRYAGLVQQGAVSTQEAEARETTARVAEAEVRSAEEKVKAAEFTLNHAHERLAMAEAGGRREDIQMAQADVVRSKANIQRLQALIEQTLIKAPCQGLVTKREAHIGDTSVVGKPLFYMVRDNKLELRAQVPEKDLPKMYPGCKVKISCPGTATANIAGKIRQISPQVDPDSRLGMARIDLPNNCGLKPGMFAEGYVALQDYQALTVPSQAVISLDDRYLVFVLKDQKIAERHFVEIGARSGDMVEIKSGIVTGDQVITSGAGFLKDGDYVTLGMLDNKTLNSK